MHKNIIRGVGSENLFERTLQRENIQAAWKRVRANKGAAGIYGMTIEEFPDWVRSGQWAHVTQELRSGISKPDPVRRVEIEKPDGGIRQLGIPTIKGRVIQQAIEPSHLKRSGSRLFLILLSQTTALDLGPTEIGNKLLNKYKVSSRKADALPMMLTFQSSLAKNCSCIFCIQTVLGYYRVDHDLLMTYLSYKLKGKELLKLIATLTTLPFW